MSYGKVLKKLGLREGTRTEENSGKQLAMPVGMKRPPTLAEQVARLVRSHDLARAAAAEGFETFEEADDFDIDDNPADVIFPVVTPYEADFDHATIDAMEKGFVKKPDPADLEKSRTLLADGFKKLKEKAKGGSVVAPNTQAKETPGQPTPSQE